MMQHLLGVSAEFGGQLYDRIAHIDGVRGALVGVDPFWLRAFAYNFLFDWPHPFPWPGLSTHWSRRSLLRGLQAKRMYRHASEDWKYRPENWDEHCALMGYGAGADPVYFLVLLQRVGTAPPVDLPSQIGPHPVRYEYRGPCRAMGGMISKLRNLVTTASDLSIGRATPDTAGTLGGILRDQTGEAYAVSCCHVLGGYGTPVYHPGPFEGRESQRIGDVNFAQIADTTPQGLKCSPRRMPAAKRLDVAIARLAPNAHMVFPGLTSAARVDRVAPIDDVGRGDRVTFHGKVSGLVEAEVRHVTVWDNITVENQLHCFGDLFTIAPPRPFYVNTDLCREGDSGAWVASDFDGLRVWYGMLIAGDGAEAYCTFAEHILEATKGVFPGGLTIL